MKYAVTVSKIDSRHTSGMRVINKQTIEAANDEAMIAAIGIARSMFDDSSKYVIEFTPAQRVVQNLMTGEDVTIDYDTPLSCDPSSETYWSM